MESAIGDMVHTALDDITAVMEQESSDLDPELKQAFADKDIIKCVILTNKRLGKDYLQVQEIFQQDMKSRRKHQVKVSCAKTIAEFNEALRHCLPGQIREVLEKRGDLLMKTKKYGDAIKDFKQCQQDDSFQVLYKIGQCQAKIGKYSLAIDSLKTSLKLLQTADISNSARVQFSKTIIQSLKKLEGKPDNTCEENDGKEQFAFDENPELFGVSSKVLIKESPEQGRFAVADQVCLYYLICQRNIIDRDISHVQDIAPGTIVAVGQPAVALLNPDRKLLMFQYCLNCLKNVSIIYPCLTCSSVVFCSQECRHKASSSFHRYQCQLNLYDKRQSDREDAFNIFMVLQVLWQRPFSFWKDNFIYPGAVMKDGGVDDDYARYWRMVRHPDKQFIKIIIISIFLLRLNRMTSYMNSSEFGEEATNIEELLTNVPEKVKPCDDTLTEDEKIVAEIIVNIFLIQDSNSHPVFRIDSGGPNNQVGLEALGKVVRAIRVVSRVCDCRKWNLSSDWKLFQPLLLSQHHQSQCWQGQLPDHGVQHQEGGGGDRHLQHALQRDQQGGQEELAAKIIQLPLPMSSL